MRAWSQTQRQPSCAHRIGRPILGKVELGRRGVLPCELTSGQADRHLAVVLLALLTAILPGAYVLRGKTAAGTQRYRCNVCKTTFSGAGKSTKRQRMPHKNRDVFALLISQIALRKLAWFTQLDRKTVYDKMGFVFRQCQAFSGDRERDLLGGMALPKLYLATDRQTLAVNWSHRKFHHVSFT